MDPFEIDACKYIDAYTGVVKLLLFFRESNKQMYGHVEGFPF